jgi:TMEM175 potassium channel family protein
MKGGVVTTSRTEAFSDGVFAIAATLLVLELKVPHVEPGDLSGALLERWPSYATYVVSFLTIGIIWVNHHAVMERIRVVNRPLLFINLLFLMAVAVIPFPTALLADYLREGHDERLAAAVYGGTMALMGVTFGAAWAYAVIRGLLHENVDPDRARRSLWIFALGNPLYVLAIGASLLNARLGLAIYALLALFYMFDVLPPLEQEYEKSPGSPNQPGSTG